MKKFKVIKDVVDFENSVIGNLKDQFIKKSLREQMHTQISPNLVVGNISLAFHRGIAVGESRRQNKAYNQAIDDILNEGELVIGFTDRQSILKLKKAVSKSD